MPCPNDKQPFSKVQGIMAALLFIICWNIAGWDTCSLGMVLRDSSRGILLFNQNSVTIDSAKIILSGLKANKLAQKADSSPTPNVVIFVDIVVHVKSKEIRLNYAFPLKLKYGLKKVSFF